MQRVIALAGIALLAAVVALALTSGGDGTPRASRALPKPATVAGSGWYEARAGPRALGPDGKRTACGQTLGPDTLGVAHSVLPCGAKIFISYGGREALTQVIDRGPYVPGREFDLTEALAGVLGVRGTQFIRWSFARDE